MELMAILASLTDLILGWHAVYLFLDRTLIQSYSEFISSCDKISVIKPRVLWTFDSLYDEALKWMLVG